MPSSVILVLTFNRSGFYRADKHTHTHRQTDIIVGVSKELGLDVEGKTRVRFSERQFVEARASESFCRLSEI